MMLPILEYGLTAPWSCGTLGAVWPPRKAPFTADSPHFRGRSFRPAGVSRSLSPGLTHRRVAEQQ